MLFLGSQELALTTGWIGMKPNFSTVRIAATLCLSSSPLMAQDLSGTNLTLSGTITENQETNPCARTRA